MKLPNKYIIGIGGAFLLFLVVGIAAYFILRPEPSSIISPESTTSTLPSAGEAAIPNQPERSNAPASNNAPSPTPLPPTTEQSNLAVTIEYTSTPSFQLSIDNVQYTAGRETASFYEPNEGSPYSVLQVLSQNNAVISEHRFTIGTEIILDGVDPKGLQPIETSTAYIVLPTDSSIQVTRVRLVSPTGQVIDEAPVPPAPTQLLSEVKEVSLFHVAWNRLRSAVSGQSAQAQEPTFTIAVINEQGADGALQGIVSRTNQMKNAIGPWSEYGDNIEVIPIENTESLGCFFGFGSHPYCPYDNRVIQAVEQAVPQWDAIVVVYPAACDCGSVMTNFPPITAVGTNVSTGILAHELGHAVGKMTDEYLYLLGETNGNPGPNCFPSKNSCSEATAGYPEAQCSLGCNQVDTWRPATQIMHIPINPLKYGPLEYCLVDKQLRSAMGLSPPDCEAPIAPTPTNAPGSYWGWYR